MPYFFFLHQSPSSLCTIFYSISSNTDEVLLINPSANVFVLENFNVHHKDWLPCSGGTVRPGELCYNCSISTDLTQMVNFPTWIPDCDSHSPALLDLFLSSNASICSAVAFPPLGNSDHIEQDFWQMLNCVLKKGKSAIPPLFSSLEVLPSASDKAILFANNFSKKSDLVDSVISLPIFPFRTNLKLHTISVNPKMVKNVITNLNSSKASGADFIPVVVLKNCEPELFNIFLKESCFQDCWKLSSLVSVFTVFKNVEEKSTAKNCHPVSLFSVVSKVFEKLVNNGIVDYLEECGLFSDFQYGFRSSQSTADLVSDRIARAFSRSGVTQAAAIDISKAFDRVWHAGFLHKSKSYGISSQVFGLFSSFLSNRWF